MSVPLPLDKIWWTERCRDHSPSLSHLLVAECMAVFSRKERKEEEDPVTVFSASSGMLATCPACTYHRSQCWNDRLDITDTMILAEVHPTIYHSIYSKEPAQSFSSIRRASAGAVAQVKTSGHALRIKKPHHVR